MPRLRIFRAFTIVEGYVMSPSERKFRLRYARGRVKFWEKLLALLSEGKIEELKTTFEAKRAKAAEELEELLAQEGAAAITAENAKKAQEKAAEMLEKIQW